MHGEQVPGMLCCVNNKPCCADTITACVVYDTPVCLLVECDGFVHLALRQQQCFGDRPLL